MPNASAHIARYGFEQFDDLLKQGKIGFPVSKATGQILSYAESVGRSADREDVTWHASTGIGVVEAVCTFRTPYMAELEGQVPYSIAVIRLEEGIRITARIAPTSEPVGPGRSVQCHVEERETQAIRACTLQNTEQD